MAPASAVAEFDHALDALAGIVRAIGRHALDLPSASAEVTAGLCERWARHVLVRSEAPSQGGPADGEGVVSGRAWGELARYITSLLRDEQAHAVRSFAALRQAIWTFVRGVNRALGEDLAVDADLRSKLDCLLAIARSGTPEELRRETCATVHVVSAALEVRRQRAMQQASELGARVAEMSVELEEARREANLDPLTRMFNRRAFDDALGRVAELTALVGQPACLVLIDVDHFKRVNDAHGHPVGDRVLQSLADAMFRTFRRRDDVVARYGGEEFAAILRETSEREGCMLAERLREAAARLTVMAAGTAVRFTVSAGAAVSVRHESPADWLQRADAALYQAKRLGRDRVCVAPPSPARPPAVGA
ncbi:MAG: GGDEF domain-containing protein [Myxococcales bacterium]|nr:GGDEF domain-containing protein [Myxococcales bacterium]